LSSTFSSWFGSTSVFHRFGRQADLDGVAGGAVQQAVHALDQLRQVDHARVQRLAAREGQQLRRQLLSAFHRVHDAEQALAGALLVAHHELHVGADDVQDVVEVVRDPARELAHRLELLRALQRRARFVQALLALAFARLGLLARPDVAHEGDWRRSRPPRAGR
jgi:hypothetical protein